MINQTNSLISIHNERGSPRDAAGVFRQLLFVIRFVFQVLRVVWRNYLGYWVYSV